MEILQRTENRGYPTDYLTSRIRGRSSYLLRDMEGLVYSPDPPEELKKTRYGDFVERHEKEGAWKFFLSETRWLYYQMNEGLQAIFRPFIMFIELKTLLICFRHKLSKIAGAEIEALLISSLLSNKIKKTIVMAADLPSVLDEMENNYLFSPSDLSGLRKVFLRSGLTGLEQKLRGVCIQGILGSGLHPVMKDFFAFITDSLNIIAAHKHLKWDIAAKPYFMQGGSIAPAGIEKCVGESDMAAFSRLVSRLTGTAIDELDASGLENAIYRELTRRLKRARIENEEIGLILDYIWKCYIEAKNVSIILYGRGIDDDVIKQQLTIIN